MTIAAVLFDLDDTLYQEMDFVTAALAGVARFLEARTGEPAGTLAAEMQDILAAQGRGQVFDALLARRELPRDWIAAMLYVYRSATPALTPFPDALPLLEKLRSSGIRTGIVTDGITIVQQSKVLGLALGDLVEVVVYTDAIGPAASKPSTSGFSVALELLRVPPRLSAYVANDVRKDFAGPNRLGMRSVLVTRRMLGELEDLVEDARPDVAVDNLVQASAILTAALDDHGD